ncbi:M23 family metallopeptidase [Alphaproteobacteria bacterium endosymbiont of Tiliacea citrago]|uniref:M23 family metallopeptidase n=1 Tax=Alphaproteobacteria bacterium endosymbiont of Tiliacea citrago TaxID=3077944 RepID=UPI00313B9E63
MKYIFLFFFFRTKSFAFEKVIKGAEIKQNENIVLFIMPIAFNNIAEIKLNSRINFNLKQKSKIISIYDGTVIKLDKKLGYIKIQSTSEKEIILVRYYNIKNINLKKGDKIKKGECLGYVEDWFEIQVTINDIIVNFFEYISQDERKQNKIKILYY